MPATVPMLIAIIGSANPKRNEAFHQWRYQPPLRHVQHVVEACEQLGGELARAGWDIVVYAGDERYEDEEGFIEPVVVRGYLAAGPARAGSVRVLYSRHYQTPRFAGHEEHPDAFEYRADMSRDWEPSFFRSFR